MRSSDLSPEAGLTLLEVIVALMIFSLTSLILAGGVGSGARVQSRAEARAATAEPADAAARLLTRLIASAEPPELVDSQPPFRGERDGFSIVIAPPVFLSGGSLKRVSVRWVPAGGTLSLEIADTTETANGSPEKIDILNGVARFGVRYLDRRGADESDGWRDRWDAPDRLPGLVEISFSLDGDPAAARTIAAAPRVDGSVGCLLLGRDACLGHAQ